MSNVVVFPKHFLVRCDGCERGCYVCRGGLKCCINCGGAEASMPTHCPQERMDSLQCSMVQQGTADYRDGEWHFIEVNATGRTQS